MALDPGARLGPYEIVALLGAGGMGEVYRARDPRLSREVAIKVLPEGFAREPERLARFQREAELLASLNHPNIAHIYGVEERALVMELVEGESPQGPLPFEDAWKIALQIADALEYAHERGIIHRDLKPANVKVTPDGVVKLLDFGLAKAYSAPQSETQTEARATDSPTMTLGATVAGVVLGTAAYMAPEQAKGKRVDKRADIWSWGVVLYEILTGERMFGGEDAADTLAHVLTREPAWEKAPPRVRKLLRRCLERDPKQRLRDIGEARFLLDEESLQHPDHRLKPVLLGVAAVAIAGVGVSLIHFREKPPAEPQLVRFSIPLPDKGSLGGFPNLAVSPDGRKVVFIASTNGAPHLWLHSLDSLESRPLAGTDDVAGVPIWSWDCREVAFSVQNKLKKAAIAGGPAQTLGDVPSGFMGGFWSSDGRIVFGTRSSGLLQVASAGGRPEALTMPEQGFHVAPSPLPDKRHYLYLQVAPEGSGIYLGSFDKTQTARRLLPDLTMPSYVLGRGDEDYILFVREGTLMAQPFDRSRLELIGDPEPLAEQLPNSQGGQYSVSPAGVLVYASGWSLGGRQLAWYDREGKPGPTVWTVGPYNELSLSPDGGRVAVVRSGTPTETWVFELARGASTRLTPQGGVQPVWSPDGKIIVYSPVNRGGLYAKAADGGGGEELLIKSGRFFSAKDWSQDGRFLLFEGRDSKTRSDLWYLPDPGRPAGERKPVAYLTSEFNESQGQFSPDGRFVAYMSDESGRNEIYVSAFPDPKGGRVTVSNGGGLQPRWRRDGKELLYVTPDARLMSVDVTLTPSFKAGAPKFLFQAPIYFGSTNVTQHRWDMTPDGKRFLINTLPGDTSAPLTVVLNWQAGLKK